MNVYSVFGSIPNDTDGSIGIQGPPGIGFLLDSNQDYDIQDKKFVNVNSIDTDNITSALGSISVDTPIVSTSSIDCTTLTNTTGVNILTDTVVNKGIMIADTGITSVNSSDVSLQIQRNGDAIFWLQSDKDNNATGDNPVIIMSDGNGSRSSYFIHNVSGELDFYQGKSSANNGAYTFKSAQYTNSGVTRPIISTSTDLFKIANASNISYKPLNMSNQSITNCSSLTTDTINGLTTSNELSMLNGELAMGTADPFGRAQIFYHSSNSADPDNEGIGYDGLGSIIRLGKLASDGDTSNQISEGIVVYGQNTALDMNNTGGNNFGYARIKPMRFQLKESILGTARDVFLANGTQLSFMPTGDTSDAFKVDNTTATFRKPIAMNTNNITGINELNCLAQKIASSATITAGSDLHIQNSGACGIYLQSDTATGGNPAQIPLIYMSTKGGVNNLVMGVKNSTPNAVFYTGDSVGSNNGKFEFNSCQFTVNSSGNAEPTVGSPTSLMTLYNTGSIIFTPLELQGATTLSSVSADTSNDMLVLTSGSIIGKKTVVYGTEFAYNAYTAQETRTTNVYGGSCGFTTSTLIGGNYEVSFNCSLWHDSISGVVDVRFSVGSAYSKVYNYQSISAGDTYAVSINQILTLTATTYDIIIEFKSPGGGNANLSNQMCSIKRVS